MARCHISQKNFHWVYENVFYPLLIGKQKSLFPFSYFLFSSLLTSFTFPVFMPDEKEIDFL